MLVLPKLYAILDVGCVRASTAADVTAFATELVAGGVTLLQYRAKRLDARQMLSHARELRRVLDTNITLVMNDRADLCLAAGFNGVHVGQDDLSPEGVRAVVGDSLMVGVSTHNPEQFRLAADLKVDYIAIGPVFGTATKENPDPVVGLEGVRAVRALTNKPIVAIGGITRQNARSVIEAGADSIAVVGDLLQDPRRSAEHFLSILV